MFLVTYIVTKIKSRQTKTFTSGVQHVACVLISYNIALNILSCAVAVWFIMLVVLNIWLVSSKGDFTFCDTIIFKLQCCIRIFLIIITSIFSFCQVHFAPDQQNKLISSSVDGLLCLFDTAGQIDDDSHLESVSVGIHMMPFNSLYLPAMVICAQLLHYKVN